MEPYKPNMSAIACMSGGYKSVFTQGVLCSFENNHFFADAYAGCSSSVIVATYAAFNKLKEFDLSLWTDGLKISSIEGNSQSNAILNSIRLTFPTISKNLWLPASKRLLIATSFVNNAEVASVTQTDKAKRLGQRLLIEASRNITAWKDNNLELHLYDTQNHEDTKLLTPDNYEEVAYASTRMLHAWHIPAFIHGKPYIDGSYTSLCPAIPLINIGYNHVICILTEHDQKKTDLFSKEEIPTDFGNAHIDFIQPDMNLKDMNVDFYAASEEGLRQAFLHGIDKGNKFLKSITNQ